MASTVWKGQLTFGMVSFPVRLIRAARKERIPLKYVRQTNFAPTEAEAEAEPEIEPVRTRTSRAADIDEPDEPASRVAPVRQTYVAHGEPGSFSPAELQRGYEVAPDQYVVMRPEELRSLRKATSPDMQILRSVKIEEVDPVFLETSYYILPGPGGEKPYALFFRALSETELASLATVTMHGRDHIIVVRAGGKGLIAHTMFYVNEVRRNEEYATDAGAVAPKELAMAKQYVSALQEPFNPEEFTDTYRQGLQALIAAKETVASAPENRVPVRDAGKVVDIMDALRKSLESAEAKKPQRKPSAAEKAIAKKPGRRKA